MQKEGQSNLNDQYVTIDKYNSDSILVLMGNFFLFWPLPQAGNFITTKPFWKKNISSLPHYLVVKWLYVLIKYDPLRKESWAELQMIIIYYS